MTVICSGCGVKFWYTPTGNNKRKYCRDCMLNRRALQSAECKRRAKNGQNQR